MICAMGPAAAGSQRRRSRGGMSSDPAASAQFKCFNRSLISRAETARNSLKEGASASAVVEMSGIRLLKGGQGLGSVTMDANVALRSPNVAFGCSRTKLRPVSEFRSAHYCLGLFFTSRNSLL